jgi:hypothetical protein
MSVMTRRRRLLLLVLPLAVAGIAIGPWAASHAGEPSPPPPTGSWRLDPPANGAEVEGYASQVSAAPGESVQLHVSTNPVARYRVEVYRIGWYGGAGGKLIGCVPSCADDAQGAPQAVPTPEPATGELHAGWPVTNEITVGADWQSGYYLAKLVLTSGPDIGTSAGVPFVVRAPADSRSAVLVVLPVNTWQAYNEWGGLSLYTDPHAAVKVSFDRPYAASDDQVSLDYPIVRFIDQFGYDAAYTTDADVDADPAELTHHRLVVVGAHSEYWTKAMRDGFEASRGLGVNLAFLGGNSVYWQIRYADADRRVLEEYRSASGDPSPNPRQKTVRWRDNPVLRPECALVGVQWQGGDNTSDPGPHDYRVVAGSLDDPWFRGTGFHAGDAVRAAVGREWDAVAPECAKATSGLTVLLHYQGHATPQPPGVYTSTFHSTNADVVRYEAPSGSIVFAVGSIELAWSLTGSADGSPVADGVLDPGHPPDVRLQRLVRNAFAEMTAPSTVTGSSVPRTSHNSASR